MENKIKPKESDKESKGDDDKRLVPKKTKEQQIQEEMYKRQHQINLTNSQA